LSGDHDPFVPPALSLSLSLSLSHYLQKSFVVGQSFLDHLNQ
jgi:hypothetical protein